MKMKDIIVMCPTVEKATMVYKDLLRNHPGLWGKTYKREIVLENEKRIMFKGETEGQQAVKGYHADIISIDEFDLEGINGKDETDS